MLWSQTVPRGAGEHYGPEKTAACRCGSASAWQRLNPVDGILSSGQQQSGGMSMNVPDVPRIKVCGMRRPSDLDMLASAGIDAVGINLVPRSPRHVSMPVAIELCDRARQLGLKPVAVVMDMPGQELTELISTLDLDFIQLHGQESPDIWDACGSVDVIKAVSWSGRAEEQALVAAWEAAHTARQATLDASARPTENSRLRAFLVDAYAPAVGGGTGRVACWDLLHPRPATLARVPLILAGGLKPENVGDAIDQTRPDGVDVASGVEESPGVKSPRSVAAFASTARQAFAKL